MNWFIFIIGCIYSASASGVSLLLGADMSVGLTGFLLMGLAGLLSWCAA